MTRDDKKALEELTARAARAEERLTEMQTVADRIAASLREQAMTQAGLAKAAGLPRDAVRDILVGRSRNPRADTIDALAKALGVSPSFLISGDASEGAGAPESERQQMLPVRHEVAAGRWLAVDDQREEPFSYETALRIKGYEAIPQWLERVRGDSMNRRIPDGALVHVLDAIAVRYEPRHGDLVIVVRSRAQGAFQERSLKEVTLTPRGVELWPRSFNPQWDKPLHLMQDVREGDDVEVTIVAVVFTAYIPTMGEGLFR